MKTERQKEFLLKLADLCEEYKADFYYGRDDDGTHICVDGEDVFNDHITNNEDCVKLLREAALTDK